jgi:hypothetical protein
MSRDRNKNMSRNRNRSRSRNRNRNSTIPWHGWGLALIHYNAKVAIYLNTHLSV